MPSAKVPIVPWRKMWNRLSCEPFACGLGFATIAADRIADCSALGRVRPHVLPFCGMEQMVRPSQISFKALLLREWLRDLEVTIPNLEISSVRWLGFEVNITGGTCNGLELEDISAVSANDPQLFRTSLRTDLGLRCVVNTSVQVPGPSARCEVELQSAASVMQLQLQVPIEDGLPGQVAATCELTPDLTLLHFRTRSLACETLRLAETAIRAFINDLAARLVCNKVSSWIGTSLSQASAALRSKAAPFLKPAKALPVPAVEALDLQEVFWKGPMGRVLRSFMKEVIHTGNAAQMDKVLGLLLRDLGFSDGKVSLPTDRLSHKGSLPWIQDLLLSLQTQSASLDVTQLEDLHFRFTDPSAASISGSGRCPRPTFKNTYQSGFLSILYSIGSKPLQIWDKKVRNGHIKRLTDSDIQSSVLEIMGTNVSTTYITCPADPAKTLGIKLPFLVMIIKNLKKYFTFEVTVLDDKEVRRRFRASNYQSTTRVKPFICTMPMRLDEGWNQIQFNLSDFTRRAYGTNYIETLRVQLHANCRIRRIYFSDRLYSEEELPPEFKLFLPVAQKAQQAAPSAPAQ
ncbi:unnamed protein product [Effrenium voratum]|uniref:CFA20 domain-containing protein n=1 Tax=Effrenium voratum TaxID=2562239 RepID=A0AA36N3M3_9DINO|nr:unnamed protein product [Effrenium voratum]